MLDLLSKYRVHFVGLVCLTVLVHYWRAGELSPLSFWILGIDCAINLGLWWFFAGQFYEWRHDASRLAWEDLAAETRFLSEKKAIRR